MKKQIQKMPLGSSETICVTPKNFDFWLAGYIDGNGYFGITQKKYGNCEITSHLEDIQLLYLIKKYYFGSVKKKKGVNAALYRVHKKDLLFNLFVTVNGKLRVRKRLNQFSIKNVLFKYFITTHN